MRPREEGATLVTGGRGYVGRVLVERLLARGQRVVRYDRDHFEPADGAAQAQGELYDVPRLLDVIREHDVRAIVHTAAISHPDVSVAMPLATFEANVSGTVSVFEAARLSPAVTRVVNFSSSSVYGHVEGPVHEATALAPITPYGVSKVATDLLGGVYRELYGVDVVSLRLAWVYGPGNRMPEYVRDLVRAALRGDAYRLDAGADHPLPLIHVQDAAEATVRALLGAAARPSYNVCGPDLPTLGEIAERVRGLVPGARIEIGPGFLPLHRLGPYAIDAAAQDLGYRPAWPLERGLPEYVTWLAEHEA